MQKTLTQGTDAPAALPPVAFAKDTGTAAGPWGWAKNWQRWVLGAVIAASLAFLGSLYWMNDGTTAATGAAESEEDQLNAIPFDGRQAFAYLELICQIGARPSNSPGMLTQQQLLTKHFEDLGATVTPQAFEVRHPLDGSNVQMTNLLVQWHPASQDRLLLVCHYDTRPFPDRDPEDPRGLFVGANDGAGSVALLMELGKAMPDLTSKYGVDFLFVDGEEFIFPEQGDNGTYFLGSTYFAQEYAARPPRHRYRYAVVLDMIADKNLQIFYERTTYGWPDSRPIAISLWGVAKQLKVKEFVPRVKHTVRDDHLPLHDIAKIPSCDVIDFDFKFWHTRKDIPKNCSALSLAKVGWVVQEWLKVAE